MSEDNVRVTYGVKELLGRIDARLESIDGKLDSKVDVRDFDLLAQRVEAQVRRIDHMDSKFSEKLAAERALTTERTTVFSRRGTTMMAFFAAVAVAIQLVQFIHIGGH